MLGSPYRAPAWGPSGQRAYPVDPHAGAGPLSRYPPKQVESNVHLQGQRLRWYTAQNGTAWKECSAAVKTRSMRTKGHRASTEEGQVGGGLYRRFHLVAPNVGHNKH